MQTCQKCHAENETVRDHWREGVLCETCYRATTSGGSIADAGLAMFLDCCEEFASGR